MKEPTLEQMLKAFRAHGVQPPPEYLWLVDYRTLGFDAFTQFEPWHFRGVEEVVPLAKRWPSGGIKRELIPFARRQDCDELACFEFARGRCTGVCQVHYDLGPPVYVEYQKDYPTVWAWLAAALQDVQFWFEIGQREKKNPAA